MLSEDDYEAIRANAKNNNLCAVITKGESPFFSCRRFRLCCITLEKKDLLMGPLVHNCAIISSGYRRRFAHQIFLRRKQRHVLAS